MINLVCRDNKITIEMVLKSAISFLLINLMSATTDTMRLTLFVNFPKN